jgi:hypothetical protein
MGVDSIGGNQRREQILVRPKAGMPSDDLDMETEASCLSVNSAQKPKPHQSNSQFQVWVGATMKQQNFVIL